MSKVWRRLQRVGKTAYKFEFTIKVHTVTLECVSGWTPNQVSVLWVRRGRRVRTEATTWTTLPGKDTQGVVHWQALEATITLYMDNSRKIRRKKFEDKYWTLVVENVGANGKHKALATKRINMADFVNLDLRLTELRQKYQMKPVASKVHLTEVQVTFISKFEKQGPATDDDMRSISSEMSEMNLSQFGDGYMSENEGDDDFSRPNREENALITREIAAIGADFQSLTNYNEDSLLAKTKSNGVGSHEDKLIAWAQEQTKNYPSINITDMTTSWATAVPFCIIINNYRPDLLDVDLNSDPYTTVKMASRAVVQLGLAPTIDALDFHKGNLDRLGILTFVDQLYQHFKDDVSTPLQGDYAGVCPPRKISTNSGVQTDDRLDSELSREQIAVLKESPKHRRSTPSVLPTPKYELPVDEEEKRRKHMIERGRLRSSKRRPNRRPNMTASSHGSLNSTLSNPKSPLRNNTSPLKSPLIPEEKRSSPRSHRYSPASKQRSSPVVVTEAVVHSPSVCSRASVESATSGRHVRAVNSVSPVLANKPKTCVSSFTDPIEIVLDTPKAQDQDSITGSSGIIVESPSQLYKCSSSVSLDDTAGNFFLDSAGENRANDPLQEPTTLEHYGTEAEVLDKYSSEDSVEAIIRSLTAPEPSDVKISTIKSENGDILDSEQLNEKLSGSLHEAAMAREAIISESLHSSLDNLEIEPVVSAEISPGFEEPPPKSPEADFEEEIQREIDALEANLEISMRSLSYVPPEPPKPAEPEPEPEPEPVHEPTPPTTPPVLQQRGPSLRDKIRGLHESRQKLIAVTSDSGLGLRATPEVVSTDDKPSVPRRRMPNSQSSQSSSAPSTAEGDANDKVKPPLLPKPLDRKVSKEKIAILRSSPSSPQTPPLTEAELKADPDQKTDPLTVLQTESVPDSIHSSSEHILSSEYSESLPSPGIITSSPIATTEELPPTEASPPSPIATTEELPPTEASPPKKPKPSDSHNTSANYESISELISSFREPSTSEAVSSSEEQTEVPASLRDVTPDIAIEEEEPQASPDSGVSSIGGTKPRSGSCGSLSDCIRNGSSSSSLSQPPPPPAPEPLQMMMGPGDEAGSGEESEGEEPLILAQDLKDVRDYITECYGRITRYNAKLDKRAKVLEKQLRDVMDAQNHELEQTLLKSWLQLVHQRNTLVRKQDELNSLQNEEDLEERCCVVAREMRRYHTMNNSLKSEEDFQKEEDLDEEYQDILKKREMLLRIREDINIISMEEEAEFQSVLEKPKLLQDQSNCRIS